MVRASGGGGGGGAGASASDHHHAIPISSDALPSSTGDLSFTSSQRYGSAAVKRVAHFDTSSSSTSTSSASTPASLSTRRGRSRFRAPHRWGPRKALPWASSGIGLCFYCAFLGVAFLLAASLLLPQAGKPRREDSPLGGGDVVRFAPSDRLTRLEGGGIGAIRLARGRSGIRSPRLALVSGAMRRDPSYLMFSTVAKSLRALGYSLSVFSLDREKSGSFWEKIGFQASILTSENYRRLDWMAFDGIILGSLEAKPVVSSLIQEPFHSIPLIWIIHEDTLANRLPKYKENGWESLIMDWKSSFSRADAVVFPDFPLAMLHSALDAGNFHVITGSPVDAWDAEVYSKSHSKQQVRNDNDFHVNDLVVLVIGSPFLYDDLPWEHAAVRHLLHPILTQFAREKGLENSFKFVFLGGNSSRDHASAFQEIASHLGFPHNSIRHYGFDMDINGVLSMADVVLYASIRDEQSFPSLLARSMFFGIPVIAPDLPIIKKYVVDTVNGLIYNPRDVKTLVRAFSLFVSDTELSELAHDVAASGKSLSENMFVLDFIKGYGKILEDVLYFPSDTILPHPVSEIQHISDWSLYELEEIGDKGKFLNYNLDNNSMGNYSIVFSIEEDISEKYVGNFTGNDTQNFSEDYPSTLDWEEIEEIEASEEFERKELEEVEERMEKTSGSWEHVHNTARKSERKKFEVNERDEGELERIGSLLCIYEIYNGPGTWPFLHRGALYRGISLSKGVKRPRSDDIDAVDRLPLLNNENHKELLCEFGAMLSVAKKVDTVHKIPWIGFQSWRAAGRQFSLSAQAEKVLEEAIIEDRGDVLYFWAKLGSEGATNRDKNPDFWTMCDALNNGNCRSIFEDAFRQMYGLPKEIAALPPMPEDGDDWSKLHSWVMPTSSFLEFMMFSRMFIDSLHNVSLSSSRDSCLLGFSKIEKGQCYCRVLEFLVNVWTYHSARKIIYVDPDNGELVEQHPLEQRRGTMWVKYFNFMLLKSMDEDLAEEADDGLRPMHGWLWPLTGEVHWAGILDREREERYRRKMDKHRKSMEKLLQRQRHGYKQKALGG